MYLDQTRLIKIAGICGILIPIIAFTSIIVSIYLSPWFSFTEYWLSDLAGEKGETPIWAARGVSSAIFNAGLSISGVLGLLCINAMKKIKFFGTSLGKTVSLLLFMDMLSLVFIGLLPITTGTLHECPSFLFFLLLPPSLIMTGVLFRKNSHKNSGIAIIGLGCLSICAFPFLFIEAPYGGNAIIELIPSISIAVASMIFGISILQNRFEFKE